MASALGLSETDTKKYLRQVSLRSGKNHRQTQIKKLNQLTLDRFHFVSDWYYDAILELSRVQGFEGTPRYISNTLGISIGEAHEALDRLERLGLVEVLPNGKWREAGHYTTIQHKDFTSAALRAFQKNILELSAKALVEVPKASRDHTSITVAMRRSDLSEAKTRIAKFRRELMAFLQRDDLDGTYDDVYTVSLSMFPMTKNFRKDQ